MSIKHVVVTNGASVWWKTTDPTVAWTELGKGKAALFLGVSALAKHFLLFIPIVGATLFNIKDGELKNAKKKLGPNGLWIKSGLGSFTRQYRPRNPDNMQKTPAPW